MIHLIITPATSNQIQEMLEVYVDMIKIVVDIRRKVLAGGGIMHADCENLLLSKGSEQNDLWGANWYPDKNHIVFEALINIRPRLGNFNIIIEDETIRQKVDEISTSLLGGSIDQ